MGLSPQPVGAETSGLILSNGIESRTPNWCQGIVWWCGKHTHTPAESAVNKWGNALHLLWEGLQN